MNLKVPDGIMMFATIFILESVRAMFKSFKRDNCASALVEFAVIVPALILFYVGAAEILLAIDTSRKLNRMTANTGELAAKLETTTGPVIVDLFNLQFLSLVPYSATRPTLTVTALRTLPGQPAKASVMWSIRTSDDNLSSPFLAGDLVELESAIGASGPYLLHVESELAYVPVLESSFLGFQFNAYTMRKSHYTIPRYGEVALTCGNCNYN